MGVDLKFLDTYNVVLGSVVAVLSFIFGEHWMLFAVFLFFNVADWITGWMKSYLNHKENSNAGFKGIVKKLLYWLMVLVAFLAGYWFIEIGKVLGINLQITTLLGWFVLATLTVNEIRSILENFVEAGFNVPSILIKGLEVAEHMINQAEDKKEEAHAEDHKQASDELQEVRTEEERDE